MPVTTAANAFRHKDVIEPSDSAETGNHLRFVYITTTHSIDRQAKKNQAAVHI